MKFKVYRILLSVLFLFSSMLAHNSIADDQINHGKEIGRFLYPPIEKCSEFSIVILWKWRLYENKKCHIEVKTGILYEDSHIETYIQKWPVATWVDFSE